MNATRRKHSFATTSFVLLGLLISAPTIGIFTIALSSGGDILQSLKTDLAVSQLLIYLKNTAILCISTALLSVSYSIPVAWCLAFYSFKGKKLIEILVILPMAMPAYILAYAYTDALDYSGWVANLISEYLVYLGFFNDVRDTKTFISYKVSDTKVRQHIEEERGTYIYAGNTYTFVKLRMPKEVFDGLIAGSN